jgi:hypothetical protein
MERGIGSSFRENGTKWTSVFSPTISNCRNDFTVYDQNTKSQYAEKAKGVLIYDIRRVKWEQFSESWKECQNAFKHCWRCDSALETCGRRHCRTSSWALNDVVTTSVSRPSSHCTASMSHEPWAIFTSKMSISALTVRTIDPGSGLHAVTVLQARYGRNPCSEIRHVLWMVRKTRRI